MVFSFSQKTWSVLLFFSFLFAYLCSSSSAAHGWVVFGSLFGIVLIIGNPNLLIFKDFMFTSQKGFIYDTDYKNWKDKVERG